MASLSASFRIARLSTALLAKAARAPHSRTVLPTAMAAVQRRTMAKAVDIQQVQEAQPDESGGSLSDRITRSVGWLMGLYSRKQVLRRSAQRLYDACTEPAMHPHLHRVCNLPDTFQSWFLVTQLHVWLSLVRLKQEGSDGRVMYKQLVTLFWNDVEFRMRNMGVNDSLIIQETTRELFSMFYGLIFAYDEGVAGDDTVLAGALWRNMLGGTRGNLDAENLAAMVDYVRREMQSLDRIDSSHLLSRGAVEFGPFPQSAPSPLTAEMQA